MAKHKKAVAPQPKPKPKPVKIAGKPRGRRKKNTDSLEDSETEGITVMRHIRGENISVHHYEE